MNRFAPAILTGFLAWTATSVFAAEPDRGGLDFFEQKIRPVLIARCYACHSQQAGETQGGLALDSREGNAKRGRQRPRRGPVHGHVVHDILA